jgi:cell division cycle 2-like protein
MDFLEHDLKTLLDDMREPFLPSETKTLLLQFISGLDFLHSQWIMHRDLKTSNLLLNNRGELKIADFGMARYYGDPPPKLTQLVVTLWYRSPELLLGAESYGPEIDMWSVGCIFGELLTKEPLLQGKNEVDQVSKVCTVHSFFFKFRGQLPHSNKMMNSLATADRRSAMNSTKIGRFCRKFQS